MWRVLPLIWISNLSNGFDFKSNLTSAIGDLANCDIYQDMFPALMPWPMTVSRPQAVMPMALLQQLHLIRAEDPPYSTRPQQTVKGVRRSAFHPQESMVQEVMATCPSVDVPPQPCSQTE